jgi:hypothetical protein
VVRTGRVATAGPNRADLGYENMSLAVRAPIKKPNNGRLTDQKQYNLLIRGVHAVSGRANSLIKTTFKALRRISLDPNRIGKIARAALVLLYLERGVGPESALRGW